MRYILCLLLMTPLVACHSSTLKPPTRAKHAKVSKRPDVKAPKLDHKAFIGDLDPEAFMGGPLTQITRSKPTKPAKEMQYTCVSTGEFHLAPTRDRLLMETWCVALGDDGGTVVIHVDDREAPRANGHFEIPFENEAKVVIRENGRLVLELQYQSKDGSSKTLALPRRTGTRYPFSFSDLVPDDIGAREKHRVM